MKSAGAVVRDFHYPAGRVQGGARVDAYDVGAASRERDWLLEGGFVGRLLVDVGILGGRGGGLLAALLAAFRAFASNDPETGQFIPNDWSITVY